MWLAGNEKKKSGASERPVARLNFARLFSDWCCRLLWKSKRHSAVQPGTLDWPFWRFLRALTAGDPLGVS